MGDWETITQRVMREAGHEVEIIRTGDDVDEEEPVAPEELLGEIDAWRTALTKHLGLRFAASWEESLEGPYFTDKPDWDGFLALLLLTAYDESPTATFPEAFQGSIEDDPVWKEFSEPPTLYPHLLAQNVEWWLPCDPCPAYVAPDLNGNGRRMSSTFGLLDDLVRLEERVWGGQSDLATWRAEGGESGQPAGTAARFGFSIMRTLAQEAVDHSLPLLLDY
jgi:hypothetical protein